MKGRIIGGAQISKNMPNFIVNLGGASARDVYDLIALCRSEVYEQFSVILHPEVRLIGDWEGTQWPPENSKYVAGYVIQKNIPEYTKKCK